MNLEHVSLLLEFEKAHSAATSEENILTHKPQIGGASGHSGCHIPKLIRRPQVVNGIFFFLAYTLSVLGHISRHEARQHQTGLIQENQHIRSQSLMP
jgi:hypothetical protein